MCYAYARVRIDLKKKNNNHTISPLMSQDKKRVNPMFVASKIHILCTLLVRFFDFVFRELCHFYFILFVYCVDFANLKTYIESSQARRSK
jgi:hypothetical protein